MDRTNVLLESNYSVCVKSEVPKCHNDKFWLHLKPQSSTKFPRNDTSHWMHIVSDFVLEREIVQ